jgi:hypothetical protein
MTNVWKCRLPGGYLSELAEINLYLISFLSSSDPVTLSQGFRPAKSGSELTETRFNIIK